jgi:hypothetical protein
LRQMIKFIHCRQFCKFGMAQVFEFVRIGQSRTWWMTLWKIFRRFQYFQWISWAWNWVLFITFL